MLARLFVIVGGLLVLVLCAALVVPPFINWTSYRADFEREASVILGRKVTVRGEATARLLPFPSVTFSDVSVAGGPDGQPAMVVDTFSMDAELAPFLRGEVLIFDMRLVHPKATIDIGDDGTVDWVVRPSSPFNAKQIAIEKLTVTDGQIELRHQAGGRNHLISEINSTISAKSLFGPWRVDGSLLFDGIRTRLSASTGLVGDNGQMRLRLKVDPDAYPLTIETDGNTRIDKGAIVYSGQFKIAGDDKNSGMLRGNDGQMVKVSAAKAEPGYRLTGSFQLDHRSLDVDAFRFETGPVDNPYTADGTASVDLGQSPHFSIVATGAQVQFDEAVGAKAGKGLTLEQRIDSLKAALVQMPKPTIPGIVEVKLPAVVAGDTTIRDVHLSAEPVDGGWAVKSLAATLPGRAKLEAKGKLSVEDQFGFAGSLLLAVGQPSGFAAWLSKDVDEAIRRLPSAGFNANVEMTDQSQTFSDLELILGQAKFNGRIVANEPQDARPSVEMQLEGGNLDVDGLAAFASLFVSDKGANRFLDRDLDFKIKAGPVDAGGFTADTIDTALRLRDGLLEIDKLSIGGLAGASISATGRIKDFPDSPTGDLDASIVAVDLAPLIDMAAAHYPGSALLRGLSARAQSYSGLFEDARIDLVASAAENSDGSTGVALSAQGNAGASAFSGSLSAQGARDDIVNAPLTLTFSAKNDDATSLLALAGLPALPLGMVGAGIADVSAKGTLGGGLSAVFDLAGEDFKAHFDGTVADTWQGVAAKGKIRLDASDIEPWMMTTGVGLPGMGLGTALTLDADADYANGLLVLNNLASTVNEAAISGDINADIKDGKPHLTGALVLDELDLDPVAVMLFGDAAFASVPKGWPTSPFAKSASVPFSAQVDLNTATLAAGQFATAYDATLSFKLDREGMRVSGLKAKLFGGEVSGLFELKNNDGTGFLSGQMELANADLTAALPDAGISGRSDFSTTVTTSGKSVDAMISALSGSGTASLKGMSIANLNADAFAALIAKADAIGRDINGAKTAAFAPTIAGSGRFAARDTDVAFAIANGTLRAPPVTLEGAAARVSVDLGADLAASTVSARGTIIYQAGDEALVGSEPALNFTVEGTPGKTRRVFDSEPLAQFLTQRALEKEQLRVEAMQAVLLEKQRLRRETRYYAALQDERERAAEEQRQKEEEARLRAEAEAKAAAEARAIQEAEAKAQAEAKARAEAAAEEAARLEQERIKAEAEAEARANQEAEAKAKAKAEAQAQARAEAAAEEAARAEQERLKAEQAVKEAEQEKARRAAEQNAIEQLPGVERAPLAPTVNPSPQTDPVSKPEPFTIDNLLRSLGGG